MKKIIPLFPLKLVMFPKSRYPLHIFEERYKILINKCISENSGFGISAEINNEISKIGCYVIVSTVLNRYDNGELDVIVEGVKRFSIKKIDTHKDGYYTAEIESYSDVVVPVDTFLLKEMFNSFERLLNKFNFHLEDYFWENYRRSRRKSFKIAEKSGLTLEQQQYLLKLQNENDRLSFLIEHFEKLEDQISEEAVIRNLVLGDGYVNK